MAHKKRLILTDGKRALEDVRKDLVEKGFTVDEVLEAIGQITGSAHSTLTDKHLKSVAGVKKVTDLPPRIDIGSPDESLTW